MLPTSAGVEPATSWSSVGRHIQLSHGGRLNNKHKKSAESDVAPAGIKSYKFLFVLKKNLFCSIQEIDRLEKWTK